MTKDLLKFWATEDSIEYVRLVGGKGAKVSESQTIPENHIVVRPHVAQTLVSAAPRLVSALGALGRDEFRPGRLRACATLGVEDLKVLANKRDVPYQSLLKVFLAERIERERQRR